MQRNRDRLVVAVPLVVAAAIVAYVMVLERSERGRVLDDTRHLIAEGMLLAEHDRLATAQTQFELASRLAASELSPPATTPRERALRTVRLSGSLDELRATARAEWRQTAEKLHQRSAADTFAQQADTLRLRLLGCAGPIRDPSATVRAALAPFYVFQAADWPTGDLKNLLDATRRARLIDDVEDLLFLWTLTLDRRIEQAPTPDRAPLIATAQRCVARAESFTRTPAPWRALQARLDAYRSGQDPPPGRDPDDVMIREASGRACFQWGLLRRGKDSSPRPSVGSTAPRRLRPGQYWYQLCLALAHEEAARAPGRMRSFHWQEAQTHYEVAIALHEDRPWALLNRARLNARMKAWPDALDDLLAACGHMRAVDVLELSRTLAVSLHEELQPQGLAALVEGAGRSWTAATRARPKSLDRVL